MQAPFDVERGLNIFASAGAGARGLKLPGYRLDRNGDAMVLLLLGDWVASETGVRSTADVQRILDNSDIKTVRVDTTNLDRWDSALIAFLKMLRDLSANTRVRAVQIDESGLPGTVRRLLALAAMDRTEPAGEKLRRPSMPTRVGEAFLRVLSGSVEVAALVGDTVLRGSEALARRAHIRIADVLNLVREAGASALGIVAIVNGLIGAIIAFVGALELQRFGAGIYVADLVGIAVVREMAAMGTAIVMAGRTGGAYAAHLATMQGNEEIDALNVFGIRVFDFLILPRIAALVTMMPLLYLYGCAAGIFGGFVVSVATLNLTPALLLNELSGAVAIRQFDIGILKSIAFGALIALSSCQIGLKAGRSAADVGRAATRAVVVGIVGIIAIDAVFAVCTNALGV